jgi:hypothetical protein
MCLKTQRLLVILLILAQGIILWQGVFASEFSEFNAVNSKKIVCHQSLDGHTSIVQADGMDMQDCCDKSDKCCVGFCHCNHCTCSIFLISSVSNISSFSFQIFNFSTFPIYLDGFLTRLFKPPRKFRS